jgi:hypothetical protein
MRRVAALAATVAAARQYARQNPEKVNRYADQAAAFVNSRTAGRYRRQIDSALRQVRKETSIPGRSQQTQFGDRKAQQYPSYREDRPGPQR